MLFARALFALIGVILLFLAALPISSGRVSLALLGAACLALAYELPLLHAGL